MKWFEINLMPMFDDDFVFIKHPYPEEIKSWSYVISRGVRAASEEYPDEPKVHMDEGHQGMVLPDLIGNVSSMLVVSKRVKEVIASPELINDDVEYLPVWIYNHKGRLASKDYFLVNPVGSIDALDHEASDIKMFEGDVVSLDKPVIDARKGMKAPDLFRLVEDRERYICSSDFTYDLAQLDPPVVNMRFFELEDTHAAEAEAEANANAD